LAHGGWRNSLSDELLDTIDVAHIYGVTPECIRRWRMTGAGPRFVRLGRAVRYRREAVDAFLQSREFSTTTEADIAGGV
jgi:predicted DNA-binding transcriptional regulator AlpA